MAKKFDVERKILEKSIDLFYKHGFVNASIRDIVKAVGITNSPIYLTPGAIMSAKALLGRNSKPSKAEIEDALSGNLCRCTGYQKIVGAVESVKGD